MTTSPRLLLGWLVACLCLLFVEGCASNPYEKFYNPVGPPRASTPADSKPQLFRGNPENLDEDLLAMLENGYVLVGYSLFNGKQVNVEEATKYGQQIGAAVVVIYSRYTNTVTGAIPLVVPNPPVTSTTTMQGSIYGSGGYSTYSGTANTTTTGGYTVHPIPYQVDRFDQAARYFVRAGRQVMGVYSRDLNPEERTRLERNRGVVAMAIRKGFPAFQADLLRGDVIIEVAGQVVEDQRQFLEFVPRYAGQKVTVRFIRGGTVREAEVQLNP